MGEPGTFHGMRVIANPNVPRGHPGMILHSEDIDLRDRLRELHGPTGPYAAPCCLGCEQYDHDDHPPLWPCRTALLVYTANEISDLHAEHRAAYLEQRRNEPDPQARLVPAAIHDQVMTALDAPLAIERLFDGRGSN